MKDYYFLLGVTQDATPGEIRAAYKKLSFKFHPDQNANNDDGFWTKRFQDIQEAYEVLSNETRRYSYDYERAGGRNEPPPPEIISFTCNQQTFDLGDTLVFAWKTVNANKLTLEPLGPVVPSAGSHVYKITVVNSFGLNFELIAENTNQNKSIRSFIFLTKTPAQKPQKAKAEKSDLENFMSKAINVVEKIELESMIFKSIKVLKNIVLSICVLVIGILTFFIIKKCWEDGYEPITTRFLLNQLGGNLKLFVNWVYDPQYSLELNRNIGWLFKIILIMPSPALICLILVGIIELWFKLIYLSVKYVIDELGKIAGFIALVAIIVWMVSWFM